MDELYCGQCGVNLTEMEREKIRDLEAGLQEARQQREQLRLDEALITLRTLAQQPAQPWLDETLDAMRDLATQIDTQRTQLRSLSAATFARAQQFMEHHLYTRAAAALESIALPLRDQATEQLLREAKSRQAELETLKEHIRSKPDKDLNELALQIERVLALNPQDVQALRWATQIGDRILKAAKRKLALHQYQAALSLVDSLPEPACNEATEKLRQRVAELAWCATELQLAPVISATTLEAGKRLLEADPENDEARKRFELLSNRQRDNTKQSWNWTPSPAETSVGPPVNLAGMPKRLRNRATVRQCLLNHPNSMFVASGLALQAVGQAQLATNLLRRSEKRLLKQLGRSLSVRVAKTGWGIDLSETGLKAIHLSRNGDGSLVIDRAYHASHAKDLTRCPSAPERGALLEASLHNFISQCEPGSREPMVTNWPAIRLLTRFLCVPASDGRKLKELVHFEARHQIPFPLTDVHWDFEPLGNAERSSGGQREGLLLACKREDVEQYRAIFERARLQVAGIQCDAIALHNYFRYEALAGESPAPDDRLSLAIADIGNDTTNLIFSLPNSLWYRSLRWGHSDLEKELVKRFKLTHSQSRLTMREPHRARRINAIHEAISPLFAQLVKQIQQVSEEYNKTRSGEKTAEMLCVGGGSLALGLVRYLRYGR